MAKMKFSLKPFNEGTYQATCKAWLKRAKGGNSFPTEAEQVLEWVHTHMSIDVQGDSVAFGLFKDGVDVASAVAEIYIQRRTARSRWMKMLRIRLSPELEEGVFQKSMESIQDVQAAYVAAVSGVLKLKFEHDASTLKIYGRSAEQLSFLQVLALKMEEALKNHKVSMNGRWLVIEND